MIQAAGRTSGKQYNRGGITWFGHRKSRRSTAGTSGIRSNTLSSASPPIVTFRPQSRRWTPRCPKTATCAASGASARRTPSTAATSCSTTFADMLRKRGIRVDRPDAADRLFAAGHHAGFPHRQPVRLHAAARRAADRWQRNPRSHHVVPLPLVRISLLSPADAEVLGGRPEFPARGRTQAAPDRCRLSRRLPVGKDRHPEAAGMDGRKVLRHHRGRAAVRRGRRAALRQGPGRAARLHHQPEGHRVAAPALPRPPRSCRQLPRRPLPDPHRCHVYAAAAGPHPEQPEPPPAG
jgi:hypothetical protein